MTKKKDCACEGEDQRTNTVQISSPDGRQIYIDSKDLDTGTIVVLAEALYIHTAEFDKKIKSSSGDVAYG